MEKTNKEFKELEEKLWNARDNIYGGKTLFYGGGIAAAIGPVVIGFGYLLEQISGGKIEAEMGPTSILELTAGAGAFISLVGIPFYLYGKHQFRKMKEKFYRKTTLFPDYFLNSNF